MSLIKYVLAYNNVLASTGLHTCMWGLFQDLLRRGKTSSANTVGGRQIQNLGEEGEGEGARHLVYVKLCVCVCVCMYVHVY